MRCARRRAVGLGLLGVLALGCKVELDDPAGTRRTASATPAGLAAAPTRAPTAAPQPTPPGMALQAQPQGDVPRPFGMGRRRQGRFGRMRRGSAIGREGRVDPDTLEEHAPPPDADRSAEVGDDSAAPPPPIQNELDGSLEQLEQEDEIEDSDDE